MTRRRMGWRLAALAMVIAFAGSGCEFITEASNVSAPDAAYSPALSQDGRVVVYQTGRRIIVHDLSSGTTTNVGTGIDGATPDQPVDEPAISGDGGVIAFSSGADNLLPGITQG